jgi:hypothetical protein
MPLLVIAVLGIADRLSPLVGIRLATATIRSGLLRPSAVEEIVEASSPRILILEPKR